MCDKEGVEGMTRRENDFYETPAWCVHRLLEYVDLPKGTWLEPCAGDGAIVRAVGGVRWITNDLYRPAQYQQDLTISGQVAYLRDVVDPHVCISNPPYRDAFTIVRNLVAHRVAWATVMLLPVGFLTSARRRDFLTEYPPDVYILPDRPSFTSDGRVSNQDYAWFVWGSAGGGGRFHHLATTPKEVRRGSAGRATQPGPAR